ncbi:transcriptional regulator [Azospirillum sp. YIM B02556]|uniref:Transcriptional regulator n=1 Tax=Azospirillum endophyticum TaxID=2800326 RepID=A0ABS1F237_9PROT|nr:transcriptional regulator [Azospirillum endophyticum]
MSSQGLENSVSTAPGGADRLLTFLKMNGPQTTAELGQALGTTAENARQQLTRLSSEGLVEAQARSRGVGRPAQVWHLTEAGHARFPNAHAELAVQLIRGIGETLGRDALDRLIATRRADTERHYMAELAEVTDLKDRVARLAAIRSREGYMAEWREDADGALFLIENHCPICAAAATEQGFCRAELAVFQRVIGADSQIRRMEHILADERRCTYRIEPAPPHGEDERADGDSHASS